MTHFNKTLTRWIVRCSPEHLCAFGMVFFGCHTLTAWMLSDRFPTPSAFATILPHGAGYHQATVGCIALPLLLGGLLQGYGLACNRDIAVSVGAGLGMFVFLSALTSCCMGNPLGTGLPAYAIIVSFFLFISICRPLRIRWVPIST